MKYKILLLTLLGLALSLNQAFAQEVDTDRDGYTDSTEINNGYDHRSPCGLNNYEQTTFKYELGRLVNRADEGCRAVFLKSELERILGKGNIRIHAKNWHTVVNAFIYGGYSPEEIAAVIKYGSKLVHPTIPEYKWKNSSDYQRDIKKSNVTALVNNEQTTKGVYDRNSNNNLPILVDTNQRLGVDPKAILFGYVYDTRGNTTVKNADIKLYQYTDEAQTQLSLVTSTVSDASGFYQLTHDTLVSLNGKKLIAKAEKDLYVRSEYNFTFNAQKFVNVDFKLSHRNQDGNIEIEKDSLTNNETVADKLFVVEVTDTNGNKVQGVEVITRIKEDHLGRVQLVNLSGKTDIAGRYVVRGKITNPKLAVDGTVEVIDPIFKEYKTNISFKSKADKKIKIDYKRPQTVISTKEATWKKDVIVAKTVYKELDDERNFDEVEFIVLDNDTQERVADYIVEGVTKRGEIADDGVVELENIEPDLYMVRIYKTDVSKKTGLSVNKYVLVNVIKGYRGVVQIFVDTNEAKDYSK